MTLKTDVLQHLLKDSPEDAWRIIVNEILEITSKQLDLRNASSTVIKRDREVGTIDHFLSVSGWDLWQAFDDVVMRTSDHLVNWWGAAGFGNQSAKAVLILDGLSLRELPWLLHGAKERGYSVDVTATASELPGETNMFAKALGFSSRSQLQNNGGDKNQKLHSARTECVDMPWKDCAGLIDSTPNWVFWHQWPDNRLHEESGAGKGLDVLTNDVAMQLTNDDFWQFVERLATGRQLVITSDHGYAATGYFFDAAEDESAFLKTTFKSGRSVTGTGDVGSFVPPVAMQINNQHGSHLLAVGRWKWRSQGGYPTLAHGGLSLLEVLSPFVVLTK